ncbi:MAG: YbaB/EbfC family nucleoid-associated protein [Planctomycetota bacterium]
MAGLGDFTGLLKQAQKMQKEMGRVQEELKDRVVEGSSGGGMVTVHVNGNMDVLAIKIDPEVIDPKEAEMLEDLILAAVKQGVEKARELGKKELGKLTGGLSLPGMF